MTRKTINRVGSMALVAVLLIAGVMYATVPAMGAGGNVPVVEWNEDNNLVIDLDRALPNGWHDFSIEGMEHIEYSVNDNILRLSPEKNWYGSEIVTVRYSLPSDPIIIFSTSGESDVSADVMMKVDPVNDPPVASQSSASIEFNEDSTYSLDLSRYFSDVDSSLSFSADAGNGISTSIDGSILNIMPDKDWHGSSTLRVFATDGEYFADMDVDCTVDAVPEYPVSGDAILVAMDEDGSASVDLTDDIPAGWEDISISTENPDISLSLNGNWLDITPDANWNGNFDISVDVSYASGGDPSPPSICSTGDSEYVFYIDVDVKAVNDPPVAVISRTASVNVFENTVQTIDLKPLFYDPDGDALIYSAYSDSPYLTVMVDTDGILSMTPAEGWYGDANITVSAYDGTDSTSVDSVCHVLYSPDISMKEDTPDSIDLSQYLSPSVIGLDVETLSGDIDVNLDESSGLLNIIPAKDWNGPAEIEMSGYYWTGPVAFDGSPGDVPDSTQYMVPFTQRMEISVEAVNDPPAIKENAGEINEEEDSGAVSLDLSNYFYDVDSELTYSALGNSFLTVSVKGDIMDISPAANWFGTGHVYAVASDGQYSVKMEIPVNIEAVDDPPVLLRSTNEEYMNEDSSATLNLSAIFSDIDSKLTYSVDSSYGLSCLVSGWNLTIRPAENWNGDGTITVIASDGTYNVSDSITVHVLSVDDPPVADESSYSLNGLEDRSLSLDLNQLFSDVDSELTYTYSGGDELTVSIDSSGTAHITPAKDWNGESTVYFTANDGEKSAELPVSVHIAPVNDAPQAISDSLVMDMERGKEYTVDLSSYFSDVDGDELTYSCTAGDRVKVSIDGDIAKITVLDNADTDTPLVFSANDGKTSSSMDMHIISVPQTVEGQNPPPQVPDASTAGSGSEISPTMTYGAMIASVGMAAMALAFAVLYLRPENKKKKTSF